VEKILVRAMELCETFSSPSHPTAASPSGQPTQSPGLPLVLVFVNGVSAGQGLMTGTSCGPPEQTLSNCRVHFFCVFVFVDRRVGEGRSVARVEGGDGERTAGGAQSVFWKEKLVGGRGSGKTESALSPASARLGQHDAHDTIPKHKTKKNQNHQKKKKKKNAPRTPGTARICWPRKSLGRTE
jgi:hypothetical protein